MGAIEIFKVADERADAIVGIVGLEHVVAHKLRQVADGFHRHSLVEQLQGLGVGDAQLATELHRVLVEAVEGWLRALVRAQAFLQCLDIGAETGEVVRDAECGWRNDVEAVGTALTRLCPKDDGQRDFSTGGGVHEHAQNDAIAVLVAQGLCLRTPRNLVRDATIFAAYIGIGRSLTCLGSGCAVVGDLARRN